MTRARAIPVSIAPMMDRTDRHFRYFVRRITRRALLYTEMVPTGALLHGDRSQFLAHHEDEHPLALQLGGDDPSALVLCARMAEEAGFDEVNLNCGCPSDRVQRGNFGAVLMRTPVRVADAIAAMRAAVSIPVTVKHRIGVDEADRYEDLLAFVDTVAAAGADRLTVHARKAWLTGLSPRENRTVPPLRYEDVHRLKRERPELLIEVNGGITALDEVEEQLAQVDGVMVGRAAYDDPWMLVDVDRRFFGEDRRPVTRSDVLLAMSPYVEQHLREGGKLHHVTRHLMSLYAGQRGTRAYRRVLSGTGGAELLRNALAAVGT